MTSRAAGSTRDVPPLESLVGVMPPHPGSDSEEWRWVPEWEGRYAVSSLGRLLTYRAERPSPMSGGCGTKYGHRKVSLGGQRQSFWVHRLVLQAFAGPAPEGMIARHLNGCPDDNRLENLAWGTPAENNADMVRHGRSTKGERNAATRLTEQDVYAIAALDGVAPAIYVAEKWGISIGTVSAIWTKRHWGFRA